MFLVGDRVMNVFTNEVGVVVDVKSGRREPYTVRYKSPRSFQVHPITQKASWIKLVDIRALE